MYQYGDYTIQQARDGRVYVPDSQGRIIIETETTRAAEEWVKAQEDNKFYDDHPNVFCHCDKNFSEIFTKPLAFSCAICYSHTSQRREP